MQLLSSQQNAVASPRAFRAFSCIMLKTDDNTIYAIAKKLALETLKHIVEFDGQAQNELSYELNLWISGITLGTLPTFYNLIEAASKVTVQHSVIVTNAWQKFHTMPPVENIQFTPILSIALASIASDPNDLSDSFLTLVYRVTVIVLMYQLNPMTLATVISFIFADGLIQGSIMTEGRDIRPLVLYASSIVRRESNLMPKAHRLVTTLFGSDSVQSIILRFLTSDCDDSILDEIYNLVVDNLDTSISTSLVLRECLHINRLDDGNYRNKIDRLLQKLIPIIVQVRRGHL